MLTETPGHCTGMARRFGALGLVLALAGFLLGASGLFLAASAPASADSDIAVDGKKPCLDNVGITVVIDFQELGGGANAWCAPGVVTSGFDALDKAGISYQTATRSPGFVCKIAGEPASDPCINPSPASGYWAYWIAPRGGQWCYANVGAGARQSPLPPGSVEGWSFSKDQQSSTANPPRYQPPAAIPGQEPNQISTADCDAVISPPPTTLPGATGGSNGPAAGAGTAATGESPTGPDASASPATTQPASVDPATSPTTAPVSADTVVEGMSNEEAVTKGLVSTNDDGTVQALGDVDLASEGSGSGSPVALVVTVGALVALGAGGVMVARRRRAAGSP